LRRRPRPPVIENFVSNGMTHTPAGSYRFAAGLTVTVRSCPYSSRSATTGSIRVARRAGTREAVSATVVSSTTIAR